MWVWLLQSTCPEIEISTLKCTTFNNLPRSNWCYLSAMSQQLPRCVLELSSVKRRCSQFFNPDFCRAACKIYFAAWDYVEKVMVPDVNAFVAFSYCLVLTRVNWPMTISKHSHRPRIVIFAKVRNQARYPDVFFLSGARFYLFCVAWGCSNDVLLLSAPARRATGEQEHVLLSLIIRPSPRFCRVVTWFPNV